MKQPQLPLAETHTHSLPQVIAPSQPPGQGAKQPLTLDFAQTQAPRDSLALENSLFTSAAPVQTRQLDLAVEILQLWDSSAVQAGLRFKAGGFFPTCVSFLCVCVCVFNCSVNGLMSPMQSQKTLLNPGWVPQSHLSEIKRSSFSDQRKQRWIHFTFLPNCTRCTLEIQFMLSPSIMLGTVTYQASSEEQASQLCVVWMKYRLFSSLIYINVWKQNCSLATKGHLPACLWTAAGSAVAAGWGMSQEIDAEGQH